MIEIMLALAIGAILMVPLGAWSYGTMKAGIVSRDELGKASATGLLNVYFLRDVASARLMATGAEGATDCANVPSGSSGTPVLSVSLSGDKPVRFVYVVVGGSATVPAKLVRHRCGAGGVLQSQNRIMGRVEAASVMVSCRNAAAVIVACSNPTAVRTSFTVRPWTNSGPRAPITVSGTRRTTGSGVGFAQSNPPNVGFTISPERGDSDTEFTLTSTTTDPDNDPLTLTWTLPSDASPVADLHASTIKFRLRSSGEVSLSASDGTGNVDTGTRRITIINRPPSITSDPTCVLINGRTFQLTGTAEDPDGDPLAFTWGTPDGGTLNGTGPQWTAPAGISGEQRVQLDVTDGTNPASSRNATCTVGVPASSGVTANPAFAGGLVSKPIPPNQLLHIEFTATTPGTTSTSWQLFRKGAVAPVNALANGPMWALDFAPSEHGEYEIVVTTDGVAGPRVPFKVNAQATVTLAVTAQAGTVPKVVSFRSTASDPEGAISATSWDFGDGTPISRNPAGDMDHSFAAAGTYKVTFSVTDSDGAVAEVSQTIVVGP